jgi:hypothetical protein
MSLLDSSATATRSTRIAYSFLLGPLVGNQTLSLDVPIDRSCSTTWSFVELKVALSTGYSPSPIPVVIALTANPDNGNGDPKYPAVLVLSSDVSIHQLYSPPSDLLLCTWVTSTRGQVGTRHSFSLAPHTHLVLLAIPMMSVTTGVLYVQGVLTGNVSFA